MAIKQIIQLLLTLQGDGASTVFTYALADLYQNQTGGPVPFSTNGVPPSAIVINNPPVPVTSSTVDANGNITITLTGALGNGVQATFQLDVQYNSGAAAYGFPTQAVVVGEQYSTTQLAPTNGQVFAQQSDQAGNKLTFPGVQFKVGAVWNNATALNTLQFTTGTSTAGQFQGGPAITIQLDQTTTLTGGAITFQGTYDNINWVTVPTAQILNPNTFAQLANPYTFVASTNQPFLILLQGFINIRANLTTVITGTGSVTPYWATSAASVQTTLITQAAGTTVNVSVVPTSNTFFRFGQVATSTATFTKVESTTYTEPTTNAQRSVSSSSASDASAGVGARTVAIVYYDQTGAGPFTETITLNGTTAVNTVSTTICFIESIRVVTVGSTGNNVGTITLFGATAGGGGTVGTIAATVLTTFWAHHYVPTGKTFHLTGINLGSDSTTVGAGANFFLFAQPVPVANQPNEQVSDTLVLYGQSSTVTRNYNSPVNVVGPARVTLWVTPAGATNRIYYGSFDYFEA